eukprot:COSAG04_NODE_477_length_13694_cov_3.632310_16_plen_56_part_00
MERTKTWSKDHSAPYASVSVASTSSALSTPPSSRVIEPSYHHGLSSSVGTVRPVV